MLPSKENSNKQEEGKPIFTFQDQNHLSSYFQQEKFKFNEIQQNAKNRNKKHSKQSTISFNKPNPSNNYHDLHIQQHRPTVSKSKSRQKLKLQSKIDDMRSPRIRQIKSVSKLNKNIMNGQDSKINLPSVMKLARLTQSIGQESNSYSQVQNYMNNIQFRRPINEQTIQENAHLFHRDRKIIESSNIAKNSENDLLQNKLKKSKSVAELKDIDKNDDRQIQTPIITICNQNNQKCNENNADSLKKINCSKFSVNKTIIKNQNNKLAERGIQRLLSNQKTTQNLNLQNQKSIIHAFYSNETLKFDNFQKSSNFQKPSSQLTLEDSLTVKVRKSMLKDKCIIYQSQEIQIGFITVRDDKNNINSTILFTPLKQSLKDVEIKVSSSKGLKIYMKESKYLKIEKNKQQIFQVLFKIQNIPFSIPKLFIKYFSERFYISFNLECILPIAFNKFIAFEPLPIQKLKISLFQDVIRSNVCFASSDIIKISKMNHILPYFTEIGKIQDKNHYITQSKFKEQSFILRMQITEDGRIQLFSNKSSNQVQYLMYTLQSIFKKQETN